MRRIFTAALVLTAICGIIICPTPAKADADAASPNRGTPVIQFKTNFFDFGKLTAPGAVSGVFKFKNAGSGVLEMAAPKPSCGCTDAKVKPTKLAPGETGEITYTINLDHDMGQVQKHIAVNSNDPKNPSVELTVQLDYTPLYALTPMVLRINLPADRDTAQGKFTVIRNDNLPLAIQRLACSQDWVTAVLDPGTAPDASSAQIDVTVHRPKNPLAMMMANVQVWATNQPNRPVQTLFLSCQMQGELSATPSQLYWVIPDFGDSITNYPAASLTRSVKLKSVLHQPVQIKNITSSIKGMIAQVVPDTSGKQFDLVLKFAELPRQFTSGTVTIATSLPTLPKLDVPVTVSVAPKS